MKASEEIHVAVGSVTSDGRYRLCQCMTPDRLWYVWDEARQGVLGGFYGERAEAEALWWRKERRARKERKPCSPGC